MGGGGEGVGGASGVRGGVYHERQLKAGKNIRFNSLGRKAERGPGATHKGDQRRRETTEGRRRDSRGKRRWQLNRGQGHF